MYTEHTKIFVTLTRLLNYASKKYNLHNLYTDIIGVQWGQYFCVCSSYFAHACRCSRICYELKVMNSYRYKRQTAQCDWSFTVYVYIIVSRELFSSSIRCFYESTIYVKFIIYS